MRPLTGKNRLHFLQTAMSGKTIQQLPQATLIEPQPTNEGQNNWKDGNTITTYRRKVKRFSEEQSGRIAGARWRARRAPSNLGVIRDPSYAQLIGFYNRCSA